MKMHVSRARAGGQRGRAGGVAGLVSNRAAFFYIRKTLASCSPFYIFLISNSL